MKFNLKGRIYMRFLEEKREAKKNSQKVKEIFKKFSFSKLIVLTGWDIDYLKDLKAGKVSINIVTVNGIGRPSKLIAERTLVRVIGARI